jgi:hypothetical protein
MPALSTWSSSDGFVMVRTVLPHVLIVEGLVLEEINVRVALPRERQDRYRRPPLAREVGQPKASGS